MLSVLGPSVLGAGGSGEIRGVLFEDVDSDGVRDTHEPGLGGRTVFLDLDYDGQLDSGEQSTTSLTDNPATPEDETGTYSFTGLAPGAYSVVQVIPDGWEQIGVPFAQLVSIGHDGSPADGNSDYASISADGRYVAFASDATNLVPNDTNDDWDVFVYDRQTGVMERVSVDSAGAQVEGDSYGSSISADGRYVAFSSSSSELVPDDTNGKRDIFVHDRETNAIERVSLASDGTQGDGHSTDPAISADGEHVAFVSDATNLVSSDTNACSDVFVRDRLTDATECVSVSSAGTPGGGSSRSPSISADGRAVAFSSYASNLVSKDTNSARDIFVYDRKAERTERVSVSSSGTQANSGSTGPSISADGKHVVFESFASNLVPNDSTQDFDLFVYDRENNTLEHLADLAQVHYGGGGGGSAPVLSHDGQQVAFDPYYYQGCLEEVHLLDRTSDTSWLVSKAASGYAGNLQSRSPSISNDGRHIAFTSYASNLVPGDTDNMRDILVSTVDSSGPIAAHSVIVGTNDVVEAGTSGSRRLSGYDFGDAPDPDYPTVFDSNGAAHVIVDGFHLGAGVDGESDGRPNATATGDDALGDDEDGVTFLSALMPGYTARLTVNASAAGMLDAWIDLNGDGDWLDADEQRFLSKPLSAGDNDLELYVPTHAIVSSSTFARFRFSSAGGLDPTGLAADGEVEDYEVSIQSSYGAIHGVIYDDLDGDGVRDANEPGLSGRTVFLDQNYDGRRNSGEPTTTTAADDPGTSEDETGEYSFTGLEPGAYSVIQVVPGNCEPTSPSFSRVTELVSVGHDGSAADGESKQASISADGRYVAFASGATNLVPGDTNGAWDVFVYDRQTGTTDLVSVASTGEQANAGSGSPSISADGRYVAFISAATNLVPDAGWGIFVYDRETHAIERIGQGSGPEITADSCYVAFTAGASDVYIYDRNDGRAHQIIEGKASQLSLSADGRYVAYETTNSSARDVAIYDRRTWTTVFAKPAYYEEAYRPTISADGRYVAYEEYTLGSPFGYPRSAAVIVYDRETAASERIADTFAYGYAGGPAYPGSSQSISGNGRFVAYESNLHDGLWGDVFVYDRDSGQNYQAGYGTSEDPSISDDGRYVAYTSGAGGIYVYPTVAAATGTVDAVAVLVAPGEVVEGVDLGDEFVFDFGDAPLPYPTVLTQNGARHTIVEGFHLGAAVDGEISGQPNSTATGDDQSHGSDDEDGVIFPRLLIPGATVNFTVNASADGMLDAWIDFNADGDWLDPGEQIFASTSLVAGDNALSFEMPADAVLPTFSRFRFSSAGGLEPTGPADDGEVEDYQLEMITQDETLGETDYWDSGYINPADGQASYRFAAARDGIVTANIRAGAQAGTLIRLYRYYPGTGAATFIATSETGRLDHWGATAGDEFLVEFIGLGSGARLELANLVQPSADGTQVTVFGTYQSDTFEAALGTPHSLAINGISYDTSGLPLLETITLSGGSSNETALVTGSAGDETIVLNPNAGTVSGDGILVTFDGMRWITVVGGGGNDTASLHDSDRDDTFTGSHIAAEMERGGHYLCRVEDVDRVHGYATGGQDQALWTGAAGSRDVFTGKTGFSQLEGNDYYLWGRRFEQVKVTAQEHDDLAKLYDGPGDDVLLADSRSAMMKYDGSETQFVQAEHFRYVQAYATNAGIDAAELRDSAGSDDRFVGLPEASRLYGPDFYNRAVGFETVDGYASGLDRVKLHDSPGDDTFSCGPDFASMQYDGGSLVRTHDFPQAFGFAYAGGSDTAHMHDAADTADRLISKCNYGKLYGPGFFNKAIGFDKLIATATPGQDDLAQIYDSAAADIFEASPTTAKMKFGGSEEFFVQADGFRYVHGLATTVDAPGAVDVAYLYDSFGNDKLKAYPTEAKLYNNAIGFYSRAKLFDEVHASGGGLEQDDYALLYDSAGNDTLEYGGSTARVSSTDAVHFLNEASGFKHIRAGNGKGGVDGKIPNPMTLGYDLDDSGWL